MIVTPSSIKALMTSFRKDFQGGLDGAPSQYQKIAMTVPSSSKSNTYGWLGNAPQLREWVGARVVNQMAASAYTVANKTYEGTVGISRDDFEDDNLGVYSPMFSELGRSAAVQPDELVFGLLKDGFNQACYDGQNFFDTEHPVYPKVDGTGTAKSVANVYQQAADWTGDSWYLLDCSRAIKPLIFQDRRKAELSPCSRFWLLADGDGHERRSDARQPLDRLDHHAQIPRRWWSSSGATSDASGGHSGE